MKWSVFTVAVPDLTPEELAEAAASAGIEGIEWRFKGIPADAVSEAPSFWRNNQCSIDPEGTAEDWIRFRNAASEMNLQSIAVVPYLSCGDLAAAERVMQAAELLGASFIRAGIPGYDGKVPYQDLYEQAVRYLEDMEKLAAKYGIKALVETHHQTIAPSAGLAYRLVSHFDPRFIGVLYDPGNMVFEGYERYKMGLELLGPYLAHVHVKNAGHRRMDTPEGTPGEWAAEWLPLSEGAVPWREVLRDLRAVGYEGYLGIEDFSGQLHSREMLQSFVRQMKEWSADSTG